MGMKTALYVLLAVVAGALAAAIPLMITGAPALTEAPPPGETAPTVTRERAQPVPPKVPEPEALAAPEQQYFVGLARDVALVLLPSLVAAILLRFAYVRFRAR